jgi:hypothetical protein
VVRPSAGRGGAEPLSQAMNASTDALGPDSAGRSLVVWAVLLSIQIGSMPVIFLLGVYLHFRAIGPLLDTLLGIVWFAIPFGSCYGARLGVLYVRRHPRNVVAWTGIVLNCLYLLFGIFMLLLLAADIHV